MGRYFTYLLIMARSRTLLSLTYSRNFKCLFRSACPCPALPCPAQSTTTQASNLVPIHIPPPAGSVSPLNIIQTNTHLLIPFRAKNLPPPLPLFFFFSKSARVYFSKSARLVYFFQSPLHHAKKNPIIERGQKVRLRRRRRRPHTTTVVCVCVCVCLFCFCG